MVLFSIVVPTHNRAAFIGKAIDSVLAQTYSHWELIIVDDASSDNTQDVLKKYTDPRIKSYLNEVNQERSASRNKGIELATGDYICFLDSDDYYYPHHLEILHQKIQALSHPVALIHTSAVVVDTNEEVLKELNYFYKDSDKKVEAVLGDHILVHTVGIHRNILKEFNFDTTLSVNEDVYLFAKIAAAYPVVHIAEYTVAWVHHEGNTTHQTTNHLALQVEASQKIFSDPIIAPFVSTSFKKKKYFDLYSQLVYFHASRLQHGRSILYFLKGFQVAPFDKQNKNNLLNVVYHLPGGKWLEKSCPVVPLIIPQLKDMLFIYSKINKWRTECFTRISTWMLLLCLLLIPFILLAFFNHPCGDDFCYAQSVRSNPFWAMQSYWYNQANGRYAATFFITFNPLMAGSFFGYKMVMLFLLIAYIITSVAMVKLLMGKSRVDVPVLAVTFFILFIYLLKMPSIVEGFYWLASVMTYQLANICFLLLLIILYHIEKCKNKFFFVSAALVLCAIISGSNEPGMLQLLYFLIALSVFAWITSRKIPVHYYALIVVTVIGILVVVLARGNAVRSSYFEGNKQVIPSLLMAVSSSIQHVLLWLPDVLLWTLVFLAFMRDAVAPGFAQRNVPVWLLILYPLFLFGLLFIGFFPAQWGMCSQPPLRSLDATYGLLLWAYLYYLMLWMTYGKQQDRVLVVPVYIQCIAGFILFTHVYAKNNIRTAYMDLLSGRAVDYDRQMKNRYEQIAKSTQEDISLDSLIFPPSSIYLDDMEKNADDWKNVCTSDYFKVRSLKIK